MEEEKGVQNRSFGFLFDYLSSSVNVFESVVFVSCSFVPLVSLLLGSRFCSMLSPMITGVLGQSFAFV